VTGTCSGNPLLRSAAKDGDVAWVSGTLGESGLGFQLLENPALGSKLEQTRADYLRGRHRHPDPRLGIGQKLQQGGLANAAIDVSDGIIQDLLHIARASRVSVQIDLEKVPLPGGDCRALGIEPVDALRFGEDYELCFTSPESRTPEIASLRFSVPVTAIGRCRSCAVGETPAVELFSEGKKVAEAGRDGKVSGGFQHLRGRAG
jgi:thiamine-monophosphate kinase